MKTSTSILCLACCITAGLTYAQDGEKKPGGDGGNRMAEFLKKIDANADGKVSKEEFLAFSKKEGEDRFGKIDANADGVADENELKTAAEKMRGGGERRPEGQGRPSEGGGFRRPPEGQGRPEGGPPGAGGPEGRRPEGGPPGQGGPEGRRPEGGPPGAGGPGGGMPGMRGMMAAMGNPEEAFKKMDKNADGSVDVAEYKETTGAEIEARFKNLDQDADGKVTAAEFKGAMEKMRGMMSRGGQGGPGGMRRPGGEGGAPGGEGGGFRRPPSQDGEGAKPEPKKEGGV